MNNENNVKWPIWIGTCFVALLMGIYCTDNYGIMPAVLGNLCLVATLFLRKHAIPKIACFLAFIILINAAFGWAFVHSFFAELVIQAQQQVR